MAVTPSSPKAMQQSLSSSMAFPTSDPYQKMKITDLFQCLIKFGLAKDGDVLRYCYRHSNRLGYVGRVRTDGIEVLSPKDGSREMVGAFAFESIAGSTLRRTGNNIFLPSNINLRQAQEYLSGAPIPILRPNLPYLYKSLDNCILEDETDDFCYICCEGVGYN